MYVEFPPARGVCMVANAIAVVKFGKSSVSNRSIFVFYLFELGRMVSDSHEMHLYLALRIENYFFFFGMSKVN